MLSATAAVAAMGAAFKSGREFAAWMGLVPRHQGTGGRVRLRGISKRKDTYLRDVADPRRSIGGHQQQGAHPNGQGKFVLNVISGSLHSIMGRQLSLASLRGLGTGFCRHRGA